jgi:hypothetical protein
MPRRLVSSGNSDAIGTAALIRSAKQNDRLVKVVTAVSDKKAVIIGVK